MKTISIIGNLTSDCVIQKVAEKSAINFTIAVNEKYTDKLGNKINNVMFFDSTYWRSEGSSVKVAEFLKKGMQVYVSGIPEMHTYINKQGQAAGNIKIKVDMIELLSSIKKENEELEVQTN